MAKRPLPVSIPTVGGMSQSGMIVAALLGGFVLWLAMNGKLASYWSILMGGGATATASTASTATAATSAGVAASTGQTTTSTTTATPTPTSTTTASSNLSSLPVTQELLSPSAGFGGLA